MSTRATLLTVIGVILFSLASDAVFVMKETERAVLLRFGALETADIAPGLHFKMPFADEVKRFDGRLNERYEAWINTYDKGKVLIINVDKNKFPENPEDLGEIIQQIDSELNGLF